MDKFLISIFAIIITVSEACLFKLKMKETKYPNMIGPWNELQNLKRTTITNCECGRFKDSNSSINPPWHLHIRVRKSPEPDDFCTGTIITSNLVVTSHECVRIRGKSMSVYDSWDVQTRTKSVASKEDMLVSTSVNKHPEERFIVEDIIFNQWFPMNYVSHQFPDNDVLILRLRADFTNHPTLSPICLPDRNEEDDYFYQRAKYYGAQSSLDAQQDQLHINDGVVLTREKCYNEQQAYTLNGGEEKRITETVEWPPLCFRWGDQYGDHPPMIQGGPLMVKSKHNATYLIGLACDVSSFLFGTGVDYSTFTNINTMIPYINYQANRYKSKWCKAARFELREKISNTSGSGAWPWEQKDVILRLKQTRPETLDCVCGVPNTEVSGRIVGGTEAFPYEFGWMVVIRLFHYGRGAGKPINYCGGTIINDRVILTAAHCVVNDIKIKAGGTFVKIKPEDVDVTLNAHERVGDPKGIPKEVLWVLFHPGYVTAKKVGYFDFDIALLVLKEPLEFPQLPKKGIRPICLPKLLENITTVGELVTVSGWGLTNPDNSRSSASRLQKIELPIIPLQRCRNAAASKVTDTFICAGSLNKYKDAASGDSGGPLKIRYGKQWTQLGVVSWGEDVGSQTAALYTDLTHQLILPFVDYQSGRANAKWCKSTM